MLLYCIYSVDFIAIDLCIQIVLILCGIMIEIRDHCLANCNDALVSISLVGISLVGISLEFSWYILEFRWYIFT